MDHLVKKRTVFPFRLYFDKDFVLSHYFDDFANITSRFVEELKFFSQKPN